MSNSEVAGIIGHEAIGHKLGGESEFVAKFVGNVTQDNWDTFQAGEEKGSNPDTLTLIHFYRNEF